MAKPKPELKPLADVLAEIVARDNAIALLEETLRTSRAELAELNQVVGERVFDQFCHGDVANAHRFACDSEIYLAERTVLAGGERRYRIKRIEPRPSDPDLSELHVMLPPTAKEQPCSKPAES